MALPDVADVGRTMPNHVHKQLRISLGFKLAVWVAALFLILIGFGLRSDLSEHRQLQGLRTVLRDVHALSRALHAIRLEARVGCATAASGATRFLSEFQAAAERTDTELGGLRGIQLALGDGFLREMEDVLRSERKAVQTRMHSTADAAAVYESLAHRLGEQLALLRHHCTDAAMVRALEAYMAFVEYENLLNQETANTVGVLTDDAFGPDSLRRHHVTVALQRAALIRAGANRSVSIDTVLTSGPLLELEHIRGLLRDRESEGGFGIQPEHWLRVTQTAAEVVQTAGNLLLDHVGTSITDADERYQANIRSTLVSHTLVFAVVLLVLRWFARASRAVVNQSVVVLTDVAQMTKAQSETSLALSSALSKAAASQVAALHQTVATLRQFESSVAATKDSVIRSRERSVRTRAILERGTGQVRLMEEELAQLASQGGEIARISDVVEEIAFQTNLLALNASIEAARAGAAGAGFSVVAEEVRLLARRSAESAHSVRQIVDRSVKLSRESSVRAVALSASTREACESVQLIDAELAAISRAAGEQSTAATQIGVAVDEVSAAAQGNEENSKAVHHGAEHLLNLENELMNGIEQLAVLTGTGRSSSTRTAPHTEAVRAHAPG